MLIRLANGSSVFINAREQAPSAATPTMFIGDAYLAMILSLHGHGPSFPTACVRSNCFRIASQDGSVTPPWTVAWPLPFHSS